jgi:hypothetical protein
MFKSGAFTFGLLASSLVMLSAMPVLNQQNNFLSNTAMAQGYNYGDSSYSQYPTEDNKYECQTGPLEGFFVSSVEFCKHVKFNDKDNERKDNNVTGVQGPQGERGLTGATGATGSPGADGMNGAQGIQGERGFNGTQGPQGIQGIQGPRGFNGTDGVNGTQGLPGPSQILKSNIYINSTFTTTQGKGPNFQFSFTNTATCDNGDTLLGGGARVEASVFDIALTGTEPLLTEDGWIGTAQVVALPTDETTTLHTHAVCFDNPPLR